MNHAFRVAAVALLLIVPPVMVADPRGSSELIVREHFALTTPDGKTHRFTELLFRGDVEAFVTLWQTPEGARYILRSTTHYPQRKMSISIAAAGTQNYVRVSRLIPVARGPVAEVKRRTAALSAAEWEVPVMVAGPGYRATAPAPAHASLARLRGQLRQHVRAEFAEAAAEIVQLAASAGSPAALEVCGEVGPLLLAGPSCKRNRKLAPIPLPRDCAFDAPFGYRCAE